MQQSDARSDHLHRNHTLIMNYELCIMNYALLISVGGPRIGGMPCVWK